jgi:hypothetical protein
MVGDHTFQLLYRSLVVGLIIVQGCIDLWHDPSHIIDGGSFLDIVDLLIVLFCLWVVPQSMILSTTPAF